MAEVEAGADKTKEEEPMEGAAMGKVAEAVESSAEATKEKQEEEKEEETKDESKAVDMQVDEETAKDVEKEQEPEKPSELEEDAPEDGRARLTGKVSFNTEDTTLNATTTLNAAPTSKDKLLLHMSDGGFQHLIAGVRGNVGIKAGRYMFELVILSNPPPPQQGGSVMSPEAPAQIVRVGFSTAGSSLILGESGDGVCFDADGIYHHGKEKRPASQEFIRDQVIGVLLNMDGTSANAYTMSIFRDGVRIADPQPLPEALRTQALFPAVSYKGVVLRLSFSGQPLKPLPFTCRMLQDAAEADSERVLAAEPEDGRYEVVFPVALPDEGCFEWVDQFLAKNPTYVELSNRSIIDWAIKSGLSRKGVTPNKGCNDKPEMGFGIPQLDDMSTFRLMASLAPSLPRNFLVVEVKGNLLAEMRKAIISRFTGFSKTACVAIGEPTIDYKEAVQALILREKKHQAEIELKKKNQADAEEFDMDVSVELTDEDRKLIHLKKPTSDLLPLDLAECFHRFSIPEVEEGFDKIKYEWANAEVCKEYLTSWRLKRKASQRIEDLQPGKFFREKSTEWQKTSLEFKKKQIEWKKQQQEGKKAKGSDSKKAEDDKPTDIGPEGSGEPLYYNFEYEDWCLLAIRVELFLLVHGFRIDVNDAERTTFHETHLLFYYNRYWKKAFDPRMYNRDTVANVLTLIQDVIDIDEDNGMVEVKLPEDKNFDHFIMLVEEDRRERQRRCQVGDEGAALKFRPQKPMPPATAPPMLAAGKAGQGRVFAGTKPVSQDGATASGRDEVKKPEEEKKEEDEDWGDSLEVEVGRDIRWDAKRLAVIERATGSKLKFDDQSGKAKCSNKSAGAAERAQYLLQVLAATKSGIEVSDALVKPPEGLEVTILDLPSETKSEFFFKEKLLNAMDENNVIAAFVPSAHATASTPAAASAAGPLRVGQQLEAKYGNSFFDAEVMEASNDGPVKVKYLCDSSEAELPRTDLRAKILAEATCKFKAGQVVEAKFGNSFFEAEVVELGSETAKVKYQYDGSIAEVQLTDIKSKEDEDMQAPPDTVFLHIYGDPKARACMAVQSYQLAAKRCSAVADILSRKQSDPCEVTGLSFIPVEHVGRCIGSKGLVKAMISRITGAALDFPGGRDHSVRTAVVGGTPTERELCATMLALVSRTEKGICIDDFPTALDPICLRVMVPQHGVKEILGQARKKLNLLEEELGVMCISVTTSVPAPPDSTAGDDGFLLEPGSGVEAKYGSSFFEAEVVDVNGETVTVKYKYDDSTADVARADVRVKPSAEALAARERHERLSSWHTWAIFGDEEHRKEASLRMMATVECADAGTYTGSGAVMPLSDEDQAWLKVEVDRQKKPPWEEKKWQEDKWDNSKKEDWPQPRKWGEEKRGSWQDGDSSGSKWENSAWQDGDSSGSKWENKDSQWSSGGGKDENATSWSDAPWNSGGGGSRGDGSWKHEGKSWGASGNANGNKRDWDSAASSWQPDTLASSAATSVVTPKPVGPILVRPPKVARTTFSGGAKW